LQGLGPEFVDDTPITQVAPIVYVGPYMYAAANGARRTVQSYRPLHPLSRKEFAEALRGGIVLARYSEVIRQVPKSTQAWSADRGYYISGTVMVDEREIVATPIR
jgi:hypothetical protein